jgi:hypothetical protein
MIKHNTKYWLSARGPSTCTFSRYTPHILNIYEMRPRYQRFVRFEYPFYFRSTNDLKTVSFRFQLQRMWVTNMP